MRKEIFGFKKPNTSKLTAYGFESSDNGYVYKTPVLNGEFTLSVLIGADGEVKTAVTDNGLNEEYVLHLVEGSTGEFVGKVRAEYERVLLDVCEKCFEKEVFSGAQAKATLRYIREKYGDELEFLWEKFDNNAIWRRKDNKKWYGVMIVLPISKLGIKGDGMAEIVDLRIETPEIEKLTDNIRIFKAYHMNKSHWITVLLDSGLKNETLFKLIDKSYELALKK